ncbi:PDR/VanB family oxidoreductase [Dactylosporangium fulvum]|uniref:PDR/VanB family oxidoreductase n=1 Tax=Dactylosporangium fulvum TaxID=53359 RepID=UPI0031E430EF
MVSSIRSVAQRVVELTLEPIGADPLPDWSPGAHVDVELPGGLIRSYSLCGDPADRQWRLAVLREDDSRGGSAYVHERLVVGQTLSVTTPVNRFPLVTAERYVFVAGGIGVTAILPMVVQACRAEIPWRLVYLGRSRSEMAYADRLEAFGDSVQLWPKDSHGPADLDALVGLDRAAAVYCCGPTRMIEQIERIGAAAGMPVHREFFHNEASIEGDEFEVELDRTGITVTVGAGQTIVDALEQAGVDVVTSCREGTCGTCETYVLEGVPDHRDRVLTPSERESNESMMICCSRSRTPLLVLDL